MRWGKAHFCLLCRCLGPARSPGGAYLRHDLRARSSPHTEILCGRGGDERGDAHVAHQLPVPSRCRSPGSRRRSHTVVLNGHLCRQPQAGADVALAVSPCPVPCAGPSAGGAGHLLPNFCYSLLGLRKKTKRRREPCRGGRRWRHFSFHSFSCSFPRFPPCSLSPTC